MAFLKFINVNGIPALEAVQVTRADGKITVSFNPHRYRFTNNFYGEFDIYIPQAISGNGDVLQFDTLGIAGTTVPVYKADGTQAADTDIAGTGLGVYKCFYNRDNNRVQLM